MQRGVLEAGVEECGPREKVSLEPSTVTPGQVLKTFLVLDSVHLLKESFFGGKTACTDVDVELLVTVARFV